MNRNQTDNDLPEMSRAVLWLEKAGESQEATVFLLRRGHIDSAASPVFYTQFYTAKALLLSRGLTFTKEQSVISAFGKEVRSFNLRNESYHKNLISAREVRNNLDFQAGYRVDEQVASQMMYQAREFLDAARTYLEKQNE